VCDHRDRRLVHATVLDQILDLVVFPGLAGLCDHQDIVVAYIFVDNAALRIPALHPPPRRMTPEQDRLLRVHRLYDDRRNLLQPLLLVLR